MACSIFKFCAIFRSKYGELIFYTWIKVKKKEDIHNPYQTLLSISKVYCVSVIFSKNVIHEKFLLLCALYTNKTVKMKNETS